MCVSNPGTFFTYVVLFVHSRLCVVSGEQFTVESNSDTSPLIDAVERPLSA